MYINNLFLGEHQRIRLADANYLFSETYMDIYLLNTCMQPYNYFRENKLLVDYKIEEVATKITRHIVRTFARLVLKIQKFACRCILT